MMSDDPEILSTIIRSGTTINMVYLSLIILSKPQDRTMHQNSSTFKTVGASVKLISAKQCVPVPLRQEFVVVFINNGDLSLGKGNETTVDSVNLEWCSVHHSNLLWHTISHTPLPTPNNPGLSPFQ